LSIFLLCALNANAATSYASSVCPTDNCRTFNGNVFARFYSCNRDTAANAFTIRTFPQLQLLADLSTQIVITKANGDRVISKPNHNSYPLKRLRAGQSISRPFSGNNADISRIRNVWDSNNDSLLQRLVTSNCPANISNIDSKLYDSCGRQNLDLEQQQDTGPFCSWNSDQGNSVDNIDVFVNFDISGIACADDQQDCIDPNTGLVSHQVQRDPKKLCEFKPCLPIADFCSDDVSSCNTKRDPAHSCRFFNCFWDGTDPNPL